jgi:hypothetical protein
MLMNIWVAQDDWKFISSCTTGGLSEEPISMMLFSELTSEYLTYKFFLLCCITHRITGFLESVLHLEFLIQMLLLVVPRNLIYVRFEVFTAVTMKNCIF